MQRKAFNKYAENYDQHFTRSAIGQMQRGRVYDFLSGALRRLPESASILELNCGTGEDALWLARKGYRVEATDLSEGMISVAQRKKNIRQLSKLNFSVCPFDQLHQQFRTQKFNLAFSNFGGLNCVNKDALKQLSLHIHELLEPGGRFTAVIMGRKCSWERFYYNRKKQKEKANRRLQAEGIETQLEGEKFYTWYYSPSEFAACFSHFKLMRVKPVGLFVPPSYLGNYFANKKSLLKGLHLAEKYLANFSFMADKADHYYIELQRK